uniref:Serpin-1 n=1 Tax=Dermanyssus gallinae TaxID=34641 RepID=A0A0M4FLE9_9ACAR|nr:serpin-1 [Dermanyssus gallinae]
MADQDLKVASPNEKPGGKYALGMSFLQKLCRDPGENFAFSPLSLGIAFSMLVAGVKGDTKKQLLDLLGFANEADLHAMYAELMKDKELPIKIANKYVVQNKLKIQKNFETLAKEKYQSEVESVDFVKDGRKLEASVNAWVASKTNDMIKQLIQPGTFTADTILVLLNAVYFKGTWVNEFDPVPYEMDFKLRNGSTVKKNFMTQKSSDFKYLETDKLKMVKIPYKEAGCYMVVALPKDDGKHIDEVLVTMTAAEMHSAVEKLNATRSPQVLLTMPKFKIDYKYGNLVEHMKALSVTKIFAGGDFGDLFEEMGDAVEVSSVVHKTVVEVDEKGTKAAAATAMVVSLRCSRGAVEEPIQLILNRAFFFSIYIGEHHISAFKGLCFSP